jgi:uncharacterized flavoprotein (TIGR03862 family)
VPLAPLAIVAPILQTGAVTNPNILKSRQAAIIGGGPAGLMAAEILAQAGVRVTIYDGMPTLGRKFMLAGRGGLNLTHSEPIQSFMTRYGAAAAHLERAVAAFSPADLRAWSESLGQSTFVGSSGRVFPQAMKASPLLRAWLRQLDAAGVKVALRHRWLGWNREGELQFAGPDGGEKAVVPDVTILALGGASWPKLGSDGSWVSAVESKGVSTSPLRPSNCGFLLDWSPIFRDRFEGRPLKRVALASGGETVRGEAMITREGIEGGAIYALSPVLRDEILRNGEALLHIDLRPDVTANALARALAAPRGKQSFANVLRKAAGLSPVAIGLVNEATQGGASRLPEDDLAELIKALPLRLAGVAPVEKAISTAGGIRFAELDENFMLRKMPGVFAAGEMLDWEAPTGGYLLQACFATGAAAGRSALRFLAERAQ